MGSVYVLVLIAALSSHCSAYVVSHSEADKSTASVLLKEGQSAEISCMTKGTGDYFWRKGETLYNSTLVAYFTVGEVSDDSQPYSVTENGTLHIRSVTPKDEGNYFCRVSSTENECYGAVKILVQASLRHFDLAIDRCDGESSCLLYLNPSRFTSLKCTALNAPPLMTLKWFNGSNEITEGIEQNEILPKNGNSREITSTVTAVYGHPASLTCQAVDPKRSNDDVRFAQARVEMTVPVHESLAIWMSVAGILAGCLIVYLIFSLIKARANRKRRTKYKRRKEEEVKLLTAEKDEEISKLQAEKEEKSQLQKEKDEEISELKGKLRQKEEENINLQELAETKDQEIANKGQELSKLKGDVQSKAKAIDDLEGKLKQKEAEITKKNDENIDLQKTISNALANDMVKTSLTKKTVEQKDIEINKQRQQILECQGNLTKKDNELRKIRKELDKLKDEWARLTSN